ncbi:MAG: mechanosensitive ion channel [Nannocystaceae bacterium]
MGFAFKDIAENYLASVLLAVRRPFYLRDVVDIDGHLGKVMALNTRATTLMTFDGNHVRLPNALVFKAVIVNYSRNPRRRFSFKVGAGTNEDLTAAQELGLNTLRAMDGVMDDPEPISVIDDLGDSTVAIEFRGWVDQRRFDFEKVRGEAIRRIKVAFDDADVEMPEPTYRVLLTSRDPNATATAIAGAPGPRRPPKPLPTPDEAPDLGIDDHIDRQIDQDDQSDQGSNLLAGT